MRKLIIPLLLASVAATPAIADPNDWSNRERAQVEHQQAQENRQAAHEERVQVREERMQARSEGVQQMQVEQRRETAVRPQFNGDAARFQQQVEARREAFAAERNANAAQRDAYQAQRQAYVAQQQQREYRRGSGDWRQSNQTYQGDRNAQWDHNRDGDRRWDRDGDRNRTNWDRNWRNDHRYDWRRYRDHPRSSFHLGLYIDPFGWGYQSFNIGYRMYPAYFGNQYWIDPAMYDLPFPPPGAAWVRYWNDAVLVDTYTGTVLDVIPGFFW